MAKVRLHFKGGEVREEVWLGDLPLLIEIKNEEGELLNLFKIRQTSDPNSDAHDYDEIDIIS